MITGEMQANTVVGAGDSYLVRRCFKDDQGSLTPGDVVLPDRAATWGHVMIRQLKSGFFVTPAEGEVTAWRVVRAFKDDGGTMPPGYDIPPERAAAWPERSRVLFERMGMIEPRTVGEPVKPKAPAKKTAKVKAAPADKPAKKPRKKRGPNKPRRKAD